MRKLLATLLLHVAVPAAAETTVRRIEAEGLAAIRQSDVAEARQQALADALQQAMLEGGARIDSQSITDGGTLAADQLRVDASGRLLSHRIVEERRDGDMLRLRVEAMLAPDGAASSCAAAMPVVHLYPPVHDIDPSLDPSVWQPLLAGFDEALARHLGAHMLPAPGNNSYEAMLQPRGAVPAAGLVARARLTLLRRQDPAFPISGVPTDHAIATLAIDILDAASGARVAYHEQRRDWPLTSRTLDLLPQGLKTTQQLRRLPLPQMAATAGPDLRAQMACRRAAVPITRVEGADMLLGAGSSVGLRQGDVLRIGEGAAQFGTWMLAQVTDVGPESARARLLDPNRAGRLPAGSRVAYSLR